ncbi:uncharacterized protein LOC123257755 [Drosophila ananassae]|uniref:uncharacterized protein LOC123257755 n=1 Tax=Drosophila ananassae TaxID=7217 RepID=UPI001CFFD73F|nr:uncharacterized protein LOC123257755 [Drosophila ananassae]
MRWIGSTPRRYKQFVGNKVAEILEPTKVCRMEMATIRRQRGRWYNSGATQRGPKRGVTLVKRTGIPEETSGQLARNCTHRRSGCRRRRGDAERLLRTTAWVLRFIRRCRGQRDELENYGLNVAECEAAEDLLFHRAQREAFPDEMQAAEKGLDVAKGSDICGLAPYLDGNGILRAYGRIDAALCIPYSARRPVILSHQHGLTEMIVRDAHVRMKHQNVDATLAEIRTRFWITRLRRVLRSVISGSSECKLHRARPMPPIMGPLPDDRLDANGWPFKSTGLDYFGPLLVTVARHQEKRWVALFTCLTTRTDFCILAIRNFICRRGPVHRLRSDNGRNFVGADREANRFAEIFEPERIQSDLSRKGIEWILNCSANPSEGGVWERMVQCVKRVLRYTVKEVAPKEHVLESFLIEAENVVNSRPLTHLPVSADQEAPLTPNDLLKGAACPPDTPAWMEASSRKELRGTVPRRDWRKGVVEETFAGTDGEVRRARVRIMDGDRTRWIMRPASKLAALDLSEEVLHGGGDVADRLSIFGI